MTRQPIDPFDRALLDVTAMDLAFDEGRQGYQQALRPSRKIRSRDLRGWRNRARASSSPTLRLIAVLCSPMWDPKVLGPPPRIFPRWVTWSARVFGFILYLVALRAWLGIMVPQQ